MLLKYLHIMYFFILHSKVINFQTYCIAQLHWLEIGMILFYIIMNLLEA